MQYNLDEVLKDKHPVSLTWHGEPTNVMLDKADGVKTTVDTGETVEVSIEVARQLLEYSNLWTLEGDEPVEQPWRASRVAAAEAQEARKQAKSDQRSQEERGRARRVDLRTRFLADLTEKDVEKMQKKELIDLLLNLKANHNPKAPLEEIRGLVMNQLERFMEDQESEGMESGDVMDLTPEAIGKMKKAEVKAALETLEVEFDASEKVADLKELLLDTVAGVAEVAENAEEASDDAVSDDEEEAEPEAEEDMEDEGSEE